jgi:hypothetical protein
MVAYLLSNDRVPVGIPFIPGLLFVPPVEVQGIVSITLAVNTAVITNAASSVDVEIDAASVTIVNM